MRKIILMMLLVAVSSSAMAEWVIIRKTKPFSVYVDPATTSSYGNRFITWYLLDYKIAKVINGKPSMSEKGHGEFDCKKKQARSLYYSWHSGNMGTGEVVLSDSDPDKLMPLVPGSITKELWKIACGKR